jgi:CRISPR-associated protein Csy1
MIEEQNQDSISECAPDWKGVITKFFADKYEADFAKYLKELFKGLGSSYDKEGFFTNKDLAFIFDTRKNKKTDEQKETAFILEQIALLQSFNEKPISINFEGLNIDINTKQQDLVCKYTPETWLTWAAENAKNVTFATHVTKLTHSVIDSPSFFNAFESTKNSYLSTSSLTNVAIDGAVKGMQYSPVYQFLELEFNNKKLVSEFGNLDTDVLESFTKNHEQMLAWNQGFLAATSEGKPTAHFLLKQTYFPINKDNPKSNYHLLCNVSAQTKASLTKRL